MSAIVLPDPLSAVIQRLRADPEVSGLCSQNVLAGAPPRIASTFPEDRDKFQWKMPDYAILIRRAGGPRLDLESARRFVRMDIRCYGPGKSIGIRRRLADQLWRTVDPVLCPPPGLGISTGFHLAETEVLYIYPEGEPIPFMDQGTDWPGVICSYVVAHMQMKVAA